MAKRKLHLDPAQPRGVPQPPHHRRTKAPSAAARSALEAVRRTTDEVSLTLRQSLDSSTTMVMERPSALLPTSLPPYMPSQFGDNPMLDLLHTEANTAVVVLPNRCVAEPVPIARPAAAASSKSAVGKRSQAEPAASGPSEAAVYAQSLLKIHVSAAAVLAERRLPLGNVLQIGPGTILKFGKPHRQPIELEVGGRRIAVGEAVTIGDRFGLRITAMNP